MCSLIECVLLWNVFSYSCCRSSFSHTQAHTHTLSLRSLSLFVSLSLAPPSLPASLLPSLPSSPSQPLDKVIIEFFQTQFQLPFAEDGTMISGLWLAVTVVVLLFIASISLVIACLGGSSPAPPAPAPAAAPKSKDEKPKTQ